MILWLIICHILLYITSTSACIKTKRRPLFLFLDKYGILPEVNENCTQSKVLCLYNQMPGKVPLTDLSLHLSDTCHKASVVCSGTIRA